MYIISLYGFVFTRYCHDVLINSHALENNFDIDILIIFSINEYLIHSKKTGIQLKKTLYPLKTTNIGVLLLPISRLILRKLPVPKKTKTYRF